MEENKVNITAENENLKEENITVEPTNDVQTNNDSDVRKKKKTKNIFWLIIDAIIILIVIYFVVGYFNFYKISQEQEPVFEGVTSEYVKDRGIITVHDYKIYKIVEYEIPDQTITYSMKLWFMEDVK